MLYHTISKGICPLNKSRVFPMKVDLKQAFDETVGHAGCIIRDPSGTLRGGWDPRSDGAVSAF